jgi:hypothetical protein
LTRVVAAAASSPTMVGILVAALMVLLGFTLATFSGDAKRFLWNRARSRIDRAASLLPEPEESERREEWEAHLLEFRDSPAYALNYARKLRRDARQMARELAPESPIARRSDVVLSGSARSRARSWVAFVGRLAPRVVDAAARARATIEGNLARLLGGGARGPRRANMVFRLILTAVMLVPIPIVTTVTGHQSVVLAVIFGLSGVVLGLLSGFLSAHLRHRLNKD